MKHNKPKKKSLDMYQLGTGNQGLPLDPNATANALAQAGQAGADGGNPLQVALGGAGITTGNPLFDLGLNATVATSAMGIGSFIDALGPEQDHVRYKPNTGIAMANGGVVKQDDFRDKLYKKRTKKVADYVDKKGMEKAQERWGEKYGHNTFLKKPFNTLVRVPSKAQIFDVSEDFHFEGPYDTREEYLHRFDNVQSTFANGGRVGDPPIKGLPGLTDEQLAKTAAIPQLPGQVEVEGEEVFQLPNGIMGEFQGPSHENGGIDTNLPSGTKIYSDRISVDGKNMNDRKVAREKTFDKYSKLLEKSPGDEILKNTLNRVALSNAIEEEQDMALQQTMNDIYNSIPTEFAFGGEINPAVKKAQKQAKQKAKKMAKQRRKTTKESVGLKVDPRKRRANIGGGAATFVGMPISNYQPVGKFKGFTGSRELPDPNRTIIPPVTTTPVPELPVTRMGSVAEKTLYETIELGPGEMPPNNLPLNVDLVAGEDFAYGGTYQGGGVTPWGTPTEPFAIETTPFGEQIPAAPGGMDIYGNPLSPTTLNLTEGQFGEDPSLFISPQYLGPSVSQAKQATMADVTNAAIDFGEVAGDAASTLSPTQTTPPAGLPYLTAGDKTGMAGQFISGFGPLATTIANRMGDTPNINPFADYGIDALRANQMSQQYVAGTTDRALQDLKLQENAARARARGSARGVNTLRALDIATDTSAQRARNQVYNTQAQQMMNLLGQKAQLEGQQDLYVMTGEQQRDLADRQDRDQFFTNLSQNLAGIGTATQATGRILNQAQYNQDLMNLYPELSDYGFGFTRDAQGNLILE